MNQPPDQRPKAAGGLIPADASLPLVGDTGYVIPRRPSRPPWSVLAGCLASVGTPYPGQRADIMLDVLVQEGYAVVERDDLERALHPASTDPHNMDARRRLREALERQTPRSSSNA